MDTKGSLLAIASLALFLCSQRSAAHPVRGFSPAEALADMEVLLERLEERVAAMEDSQGNPDGSEMQGGRQAEDDPSDQPGAEGLPAFSDRAALLEHMRGVQAAKSMRESGCFGRRLDRIGSVSGMGCKGSRRH